MGWRTRGTGCLTFLSTLLQIPDWSCTTLCKCMPVTVMDDDVNLTLLQNDRCWPEFLGPCVGTWSDQTLSLRYPTRIPTGSAVLDSQTATGSKCRTAPICEGQKKDILTAKSLPERWNNKKKKNQKQLLQRFEKCGDAKECSQMTPCSRFYVGSPERRRSCMDLVSQLAMFYLCTFSFQNLSAADTEVHLMKKCRYLYLCSCACCALHLVCSLYGPKWTNMISLWIKSKTQFSWDSQRTYAA